ncbi:MAG: hypothetical protein JWO03_3069 [Bacteroidetes bacterium]|nr:hypothetical protein [Bacteroidota bacterium]
MTKLFKPAGLLTAMLLFSLCADAQTSKESPFITELRQKLKAKMKCTDAQTDSVVDAEVIYMKEMRKLQKDSTLTVDQKEAQSKSIRTKRNDKIQSSLQLSHGQMRKVLPIIPDTVPKPVHTKID